MNNAPLLDNNECDKAIRATFLHFIADPDTSHQAWEYIEDGLLILNQGGVVALGNTSDWLDRLPDGIELTDYSGKLIMPGFFDTHTHYPQTEMIASYGAQVPPTFFASSYYETVPPRAVFSRPYTPSR